jgi:hypothetical protein
VPAIEAIGVRTVVAPTLLHLGAGPAELLSAVLGLRHAVRS